MQLSLIAAMSTNRVIGRQNNLPWHLPADLKHFKTLTLNKPILMGRKTFDSLGNPLPNRQNVVITRQTDWQHPGTTVLHSLQETNTEFAHWTDVMVIGGGELFQQALPMAQRIYLTIIHMETDGDAFFPELDPWVWQEISREPHQADKKNAYDYTFLCFERSVQD